MVYVYSVFSDFDFMSSVMNNSINNIGKNPNANFILNRSKNKIQPITDKKIATYFFLLNKYIPESIAPKGIAVFKNKIKSVKIDLGLK